MAAAVPKELAGRVRVITTEEMIRRLPKLATIMDERWLRENRDWFEAETMPRAVWYEQLEQDLTLLSGRVPLSVLIGCYRDPLRSRVQFLHTLYEIHGAALFAASATRLELHVPRGDGSARNFDLRAEIRGHPVNVESKTRKDEFPFNLPPDPGEPTGTTSRWGGRETVDPHDAAELGFAAGPRTPDLHHIATPESTVIRQLLLDGLLQLPERGHNFILFGHLAGDRAQLERALRGMEVAEFVRNLETKEVTSHWVLLPLGAFSGSEKGEPFRPLSAVLWMRLWEPLFESGGLGRAYKLYRNRNAQVPLPDNVIEVLEAVMRSWTTPTESQESLVEGYSLETEDDSE